MALDSPDYQLERTIGSVEVRKYEPYLVASTRVSGSLQGAGNAGFGILARYIFGANDSGDGSSTKIAMTTPVIQVPDEESFTVRFMMPHDFTSESLPTPNDDRVTLEEVGAQRLAALPYRGSWSKGLHDRNLRELRRTLDREGLDTEGEPIWARYDPPWKPWFLRHNEVLLALKD
ncbi:MAG: heme-binding protein [Actinomycetia bacterium]|nr:heme-binding protein [Actinomycetes bacterium]